VLGQVERPDGHDDEEGGHDGDQRPLAGAERLVRIQISSVSIPGPAVNVVTMISSKLRPKASTAPASSAERSMGKVLPDQQLPRSFATVTVA
jgi:hypothetical protein